MSRALTHSGRVTHICVSKQISIGSDNGLSPGRRQAIIWTNAGKLLIGPLGTNFSEILIEIYKFSFKRTLLKMSSGKWRPSCLGLNVLNMLCSFGQSPRSTEGQIWVSTIEHGRRKEAPINRFCQCFTGWDHSGKSCKMRTGIMEPDLYFHYN